MTISTMPSKTIPWFKRLSFRLISSFSAALFLTAIILNALFWGQGRPWLEQEAIKFNKLLGENLVHALSEETRGIEGLTRSLAITAMNSFGDEDALLKNAPDLFDAPGYRNEILGGGVWPAPYTWDPSIERSSYFWGRLLSKELKLYFDYNTSKRGYVHEEWFTPTRYLANGQIYWSRTYTDPFSLEPMITASAPLNNEGRNMGAVTIDISLKRIHSIIQTTMEEVSGYAYVIDRSNRFISFPSQNWIKTRRTQTHKNQTLEDFLTAEELAANHPMFLSHLELIRKGALNSTRYYKAENDKLYWIAQQLIANSDHLSINEASRVAHYIYGYEKLSTRRPQEVYQGSIDYDFKLKEAAIISIFEMPNTQWQVITVLPLDEAFSFADKMSTSVSLVVSCAILLIGLLMIFFVKRDVLNRLASMETALNSDTSPSQKNHLIKVEGSDELSLLAQSFNDKTRDLIEARKTAEHSERSKILFLGTISHEFRTPLNSILGFSSFLEKRLTHQVDVKYIEALNSIHDNGQYLLKMINRVIQVSELEAGKTPFKPHKVNISSWLRSLIYNINSRMNEEKIDIVISEPHSEDPSYYLDTSLLTKALEQIIENSLEATTSGKIFISWKRKFSHQQHHLKIIVRDTGTGIPREKLNQLFQRFTNLNEELGSGFGAGLGLYLAKLCIERHQGEIHISSIENSGTTVSITLNITTMHQ
jgi:signal transduction histidine kinase